MKNKIMKTIDKIIFADITEKIMLPLAHIGIVAGIVMLVITFMK